jgi:hypothetical protein
MRAGESDTSPYRHCHPVHGQSEVNSEPHRSGAAASTVLTAYPRRLASGMAADNDGIGSEAIGGFARIRS